MKDEALFEIIFRQEVLPGVFGAARLPGPAEAGTADREQVGCGLGPFPALQDAHQGRGGGRIGYPVVFQEEAGGGPAGGVLRAGDQGLEGQIIERPVRNEDDVPHPGEAFPPGGADEGVVKPAARGDDVRVRDLFRRQKPDIVSTSRRVRRLSGVVSRRTERSPAVMKKT